MYMTATLLCSHVKTITTSHQPRALKDSALLYFARGNEHRTYDCEVLMEASDKQLSITAGVTIYKSKESRKEEKKVQSNNGGAQ